MEQDHDTITTTHNHTQSTITNKKAICLQDNYKMEGVDALWTLRKLEDLKTRRLENVKD